jgi:ElaB/YqjD/DUF883 family membrane-anchored ribosome-binding protein
MQGFRTFLIQMELMDKSAVYDACVKQLSEQIAEAMKATQDAQESVFSNSKSSAGDKHETGRAMAQIELEKLSNNLLQSKQVLSALHQVKKGKSEVVERGALCETDLACFYVAVSLGMISLEGKSVFCLSPAAPLAQAMLGLIVGDSFEINGKKQTIKAIY